MFTAGAAARSSNSKHSAEDNTIRDQNYWRKQRPVISFQETYSVTVQSPCFLASRFTTCLSVRDLSANSLTTPNPTLSGTSGILYTSSAARRKLSLIMRPGGSFITLEGPTWLFVVKEGSQLQAVIADMNVFVFTGKHFRIFLASNQCRVISFIPACFSSTMCCSKFEGGRSSSRGLSLAY